MLVSGCEIKSSKQAYIADAKRFCAMFSPAVWQEMKKDFRDAELQHEFLRRMGEAVKTPEFIRILSEQHKIALNPSIRYQYYVQQVSQLTGQPFSCPDLKTYLDELMR